MRGTPDGVRQKIDKNSKLSAGQHSSVYSAGIRAHKGVPKTKSARRSPSKYRCMPQMWACFSKPNGRPWLSLPPTTPPPAARRL